MEGSLYLQYGRWYWKVKLPGESKRRTIPLVPANGKHATTDRVVAEEVAHMLWKKHLPKAFVRRGTMGELADEYLEWAKIYYRTNGKPSGHLFKIRNMLLHLKPFESILCEDFGPRRLDEFREHLINLRNEKTKRQRLCRRTVNTYVNLVRTMIQWGVKRELVPSHIYYGLLAVKALMVGRSNARETDRVLPVDPRYVEKVAAEAGPVVGTMIRLQMLTGMRSSEMCTMRPMDIDTSGRVWLYKPIQHKTKHLGRDRFVVIGPKAQKVLKPFLNRKIDAYCFSPKESVKAHRTERHKKRITPMSCGNRPGDVVKLDPKLPPGDRYDQMQYRQALEYAIAMARKKDKTIPDFHPHQLRHTAGTMIRKEFGLDAARSMLGHRTLGMTDQYAELDVEQAMKVAQKIG